MIRVRRAGFSLIEMLAVVAIFALMASLVLPNLSFVNRRSLWGEAEDLAAWIELARQRTVVTAVPHRVVLDLEGGSYHLEWQSQEQGDADAPESPFDLRGNAPLPLAAPRNPDLEFHALPGEFGRRRLLDDDVFFSGVETPAGWVERGEAFLPFERNGTSEYTLIVLGNEAGDALEIEVLPLADAVRVRNAES